MLNQQLVGTINPFTAQLLSMLGGRLGDALTKVWPYYYAIDIADVAQNQSASGSIPVSAGNDFFCQQVMLSAQYDSATTPTGMVEKGKPVRHVRDVVAEQTNASLSNISMRYQINDRPFMDQFVRSDLVAGDPGNPVWLPSMLYVPGNQTILTEIQNNMPTVGTVNPTLDVQVVFCGIKAERSVAQRILNSGMVNS